MQTLNPIKMLQQIKTLLSILLIFLPVLLMAQIITVKQDGTGDFSTIQSAINSADNGDTILVWPGTYYENVDYSGKNITLSSRMLTTGDPSYKYNTIIDGNHNGSCVLVNKGEKNAYLYGLKLQHGSGFSEYTTNDRNGGGIYINYSSTLNITNCIIRDNIVTNSGGGILCGFYSNAIISATTICNNHAYLSGGGVAIGYQANFVLDTINLNSIFLNYSQEGCDLNKPKKDFNIKLDTATVLNPDSYFYSSIDNNGFQQNDITFNILHQKITPVDTDLYVNPVIGNDTNSGLTPQTPLKAIAFAYSKIIPDSINKNTIYLADGIYSDTVNGEKFPLNIRSYINVTGESRDGTILDGEYKTKLLKGNNEVCNFSFSKMTLRRGTLVDYENTFVSPFGLVFLYYPKNDVVFDSVKFTEGLSRGGYGTFLSNLLLSGCTLKITNSEFSANTGDAALRVGLNTFYDSCIVSNCVFNANKPDTNDPDPSRRTGRGFDSSGDGIAIIYNSLFIDNDNEAIISPDYSDDFLVNCTFLNNSLQKQDNSITFWFDESTTTMYNCIVYNNGGDKTFALSNIEHLVNTNLNIYNSLIENGTESIEIGSSCNGDCFYYYDTTNIDTDPLFYGGPDFPYNLSNESPCIDAGTLDLPQFILDNMPDTDLAGNPRIVNDKIDMGCYEWNPTVGTDEHQTQNPKRQTPNLQVFPNPFSTATNIAAQWKTTAQVNIEVYNAAGLLVKTLQSGKQLPGSCQIPWDGTDNIGNKLPAGIYFVILRVNGREKESVKVMRE